MKNSNDEQTTMDKKIPLDQNILKRKQLSVAGRIALICTSILFWVVGNTLPESEYILKLFSKIVSVLSILNYTTWNGQRGIIGTLDFLAVHISVIIFMFRLLGKPSHFMIHWLGILITFILWKTKTKAEGQLWVHLIALFNIYIYGMFLKMMK